MTWNHMGLLMNRASLLYAKKAIQVWHFLIQNSEWEYIDDLFMPLATVKIVFLWVSTQIFFFFFLGYAVFTTNKVHITAVSRNVNSNVSQENLQQIYWQVVSSVTCMNAHGDACKWTKN